MDSVQRDVTIMFTDIVGYSAMIGRNESHALKLLDEHNQTIEPTIKSHNGRIIKHIGDAIFAEFDNPTDAVNASIIFQNKFKERNSLSRREDHIQIRVGLHKGEVVVKEDDLFGNAVNIGSRIESIAPLGGIAISNDLKQSQKMNFISPILNEGLILLTLKPMKKMRLFPLVSFI